MDFKHTYLYKHYVVFVGVMILLVGSILAWIANARLESFHQYHFNISHESAKGVEKQVAFYISEKQRMVNVFAKQQIDLIQALASDPNNDDLRVKLGRLLKHYFPDQFAFSIANNIGEPLFENFDGLIKELCLADIQQFSKKDDAYHPYIHPNSEGYHFDIMVRYGEGNSKDGKTGIFFVSFRADLMGDIIKSIQSHSHQLMLILPQQDNLIEVIADGARNHWDRNDYRLSKEELARISMRHNIAGTRWQVIDFHNPDLHSNYRINLAIESVGIFLVFLTVALLLVFRLMKEEQQREFAEKQKKALMGVVSHEFRSPAAVIKTALDLVAEGDAGEVSEEVKTYIDIASKSTSRLLLLVNDFLDIQKIESGNLQFNKEKVQLSKVVTEAISVNKLYAEQFSACYELKEPLANDIVSCDAHRIEQVLTNFLSNAAKYGGDNDTIEVSVTRIGKQLRVSVSDHGPGIPKKFQPHVFEAFAMTNAPKKAQDKDVQSSGLGLSIAKAIIEQHNGKIGFITSTNKDVAAESETGTTFWFELPVI